MAPPKFGAPTVTTHKKKKIPLIALVFVEKPRASALQMIFFWDYILPRKDTAP
jgi:hypothetical protein